MDLFVNHYGLSLAIVPLWCALAYARASALVPQLRRRFSILAMLAGLATLYVAMIYRSSSSQELETAVRTAFIWLLAVPLLLGLYPGAARGMSFDQLLRAIGLSRADEIVRPSPSPAPPTRAVALLLGLGVASLALFGLGRQLQPCAPLDLGLGRSGCFAQITVEDIGRVPPALAPAGDRVLVDGGTDLLIVEPDAGRVLHRLALDEAELRHALWLADGRVAALGDTGAIFIWDGASGRLLQQIAAEPLADMRIAFDAAGERVAVGGRADVVTILSAADGRVLRQIKLDTAIVRGMAFSPDGAALALALRDTVQIYDLGRDALLPDALPGYGVALWRGDGQSLVIHGDNQLTVARRTPAGLAEEAAFPTSPRFLIKQVLEGADGQPLALRSLNDPQRTDDMAQVWRPADDAVLHSIDLRDNSGAEVDISADRATLLSVDYSYRAGTDSLDLRLWRVPPLQ